MALANKEELFQGLKDGTDYVATNRDLFDVITLTCLKDHYLYGKEPQTSITIKCISYNDIGMWFVHGVYVSEAAEHIDEVRCMKKREWCPPIQPDLVANGYIWVSGHSKDSIAYIRTVKKFLPVA